MTGELRIRNKRGEITSWIELRDLATTYRWHRTRGVWARGAIVSARAELWALEEQTAGRLRITVLDDDDYDTSWVEGKEREKLERQLSNGSLFSVGVRVERLITTCACGFCGRPETRTWKEASSVWGVLLTDWLDPYLRDTLVDLLIEASGMRVQ